ncbi:hypothetical protein A3B42_02065 [Candidatus Daviesbacteria bacterium RIFCSPLOWO2_01_FULL_38_10]|uniref:Nudix hydrolase domain-containing protein n=1 Tax=Candidatus Daviesbacteria bacterium GW2011_GWF2_38_6 TaxID=1618432 RepID=A0A0G0MZR0_9BACT|nr:MAG: hypothetical protein US80_C0006G0016 [Candidatus Daviesbacteria bacterium GW2011_GWA2_38_17]KKQ79084.1 MAG: hypothetical protein US99_C0003G0005 [Candidatus Daviesbacteria bacterium GW2011_GWF2_38_6]OGE25868.1 MAG: hypothetical protein A3D02_01385 [Candidatus Daviesbacteria bacterium RIFCSPHIGHO2_02_FULL_39_41]OGE29709.1 MAG: hypothetical protein A2772_02995 [Candidatus Daviesbacteria bacterium RIFCSPHIGHO2_01_FULL_38_8b]OGE39121.1 MAG: hypothetical protein A3B42_02065 [Candidatus Davie
MIKHFAATAYIVSKIDGEVKVLLHKHKKLGIWIGVGGHVEKEENPKQAVIREAKEEYGWFSLKNLNKMDLRPEAKRAAQNAIKTYT